MSGNTDSKLIQLSALHGRTESSHRSLAWKMLHNAVIGPVSTDHPYFQAFYKGLILPCKPISLDLPQLASNFCGGIGEFVYTLLDTRITGDYDDLRLVYSDRSSVNTRSALQDAFEEADPNWAGIGFRGVFKEFLEGKGCPCHSLMEESRGCFDELANLDRASENGFRMKMFCWATTGTPQIILDGAPIEVTLVDDNDAMYFTSHLLKLLKRSYDGVSEPRNAKESVFHWIMFEILNAIGNYNVI
ncbi:hypothetical protein EV360DRAFT_52656 [Lentinula raphanica]|nr:hypothetical protein EV360DRAFT_52656 [Lentinula raphanica]